MKNLIKKAVYNKFVARLVLPIFSRLDNACYKNISQYSVILNDGVHPKHRLMNYHQFFVDNISKEDSVLDIGCGIGANAYDIAQKANKVIGIDFCKKNIEFAKKNYQAENIEYILGDATKDLDDRKFDVIVMSNVLEHIKDRDTLLKSVRDLAPKILIRVPMIDRDWLVLYKKEKGIEWRLDDTHYIEYTMEDFEAEMKEAGLYVENYSVKFGEIWAIVKTLNDTI